MISFSSADLVIIILFFISVLSIGFFFGRSSKNDTEDYLLSGRKVGLLLFILTNVATWYGGILGVGEFVYRYGIVSWFTQGFPYYIFAFLFAIFFAKKIREASLFTIPDKLSLVYGEKVGLTSAVLVFALVSPAPYLLMTGSLFSFLQANLPKEHLNLTGNASPTFILVWFLIALWTFADPGFHQRCYAAKSGTTAVKGIIISIAFWFLFDSLTTLTGLYARAYLPNISNPTLSYPLLAEAILPSGIKGIFYAALFATIMSTLNSFLFLSATTISRDFLFKLYKKSDEKKLKTFAIYGLMLSGVMSVLLAYFIPSVIEIWYTIGSICIPGIILPVVSSYYIKLKIDDKLVLSEMMISVLAGLIWFFF